MIQRVFVAAGLVSWLILFTASVRAQANGLDVGYRDLYNLQFADAHQVFQDWQRQRPDDPLGPVSDAAAYLFSEFDRLNILQLEFFANDQNFQGQHSSSPDPAVKQRFSAALDKTEQLAANHLAKNPKDADALFATVLMLGLHGDYLALIEKRNLAGLSYMKQARARSKDLLKVDPTCYDAYLAAGVENYLLSLKPAPLRWMLEIGGAEADKTTGIEDLRLTAEKGHYLLPYAKLLLAVAALRDDDRNQARQILQGLSQTFPKNRLYAQELEQLR